MIEWTMKIRLARKSYCTGWGSVKLAALPDNLNEYSWSERAHPSSTVKTIRKRGCVCRFMVTLAAVQVLFFVYSWS